MESQEKAHMAILYNFCKNNLFIYICSKEKKKRLKLKPYLFNGGHLDSLIIV